MSSCLSGLPVAGLTADADRRLESEAVLQGSGEAAREYRMDKQPPPAQVQIQIDPNEAIGIYANFVVLTHSDHEFILDFARNLPGLPRPKVFSRILMTPATARSFLGRLQAMVEGYEAQYGKIRTQGELPPVRDIGFKPESH
jgi:hypothetical protein